jgi:hypothetical protein
MKRSRQASRPITLLGLALAALHLAALVWTTGCSRQVGVPGQSATAKTTQLPFDRVSDGGGISPTAGFSFDGIPAGTELTIRLQSALSSAKSRMGDSFPAVIDDPVIVAGRTIALRGATVTGSIVAAKASGDLHDPGYLRVTLTSIVVNGKTVPLRTSSIFAKGGSYGKRVGPTTRISAADGHGVPAGSALQPAKGDEPSFTLGHGDVRFSTGHRLTFRVAQPLHPQG